MCGNTKKTTKKVRKCDFNLQLGRVLIYQFYQRVFLLSMCFPNTIHKNITNQQKKTREKKTGEKKKKKGTKKRKVKFFLLLV